MSCFSACFRKSKRRRSPKPTIPTPSSDQFWQKHECVAAVQLADAKEQENAQILINPNPDSIDDEQKEKLSASGRKKVTFDSKVQIYEELPPTDEIHGSEEKKESSCSSDCSSSSTQNPLPNTYRYQNCRDSDDDEFSDEVLSDDDSEIDYMGDDEDEDEESDNEAINDEKLVTENSIPIQVKDDKITDEIKSFDSVLHPVENLSQWKEIKAKGKLEPKNNAKENKISGLGCEIKYSEEPGMKPNWKSDKAKNSSQEMAVDASLSSWLTPTKGRANSVSVGNSSPCSERNYSPKDFEDRPILGVLTVEDIRQFSANSTPRRSPTRSPDDMPIIGSVGSYWS